MKTLLKNLIIVPMTGEDDILTGDIGINGKKIAFVGNNPSFMPDEAIDMHGMLALPSFVNAHTHLAMEYMRNYKDDSENLQAWLGEIFPIEDKLKEEDIYASSLLGAAELIKTGCTTFADMYFMAGETVKAAKVAGIRGVIGQTFFGDVADSRKRVETQLPRILEAIDGDEAFRADLAPHAVYTVTEDSLKFVSSYAKKHGYKIHMHLSETEKEVNDCLKEHGMAPVEYVKGTGMLESECYFAHCVHLNDDEAKTLKDSNASIVHNPSSNCKLASGIAPIAKYREMGVNVALGSDGASSNNNLSIIKEMTLASMLSSVSTKKPSALKPYEIVRMATINGAKALRLDDRIGTLEKGKDADLVIIDTNKANMAPLNGIYSAIVFTLSERNIHTVYSRGRKLLDNGKLTTIDEEKAISIVQRHWKGIQGR